MICFSRYEYSYHVGTVNNLTDAEIEDMADVKGDLTAYILAQTAEIPENGETISCDLILAFYDTDGALVKVTTTEAELSGDMDMFEKPIIIPENTRCK